MIKKFSSILLCLCLLLSLATAQAVQAEEQSLKFNDDFSYSFDTNTLRDNMVAQGWEEDTLNVWDSAAFDTDYNCEYQMIDDGSGGTALQLSRDKCLPNFNTLEYTFDKGTLECSVRLKIVDDKLSQNPDSYLLSIGSGFGEKLLHVQNGMLVIKSGEAVVAEKAYALNSWYTIVWALKNADDGMSVNCIVKDSKGAVFLETGDFKTNLKGSIYIGGGAVEKGDNDSYYEYSYAIDDVKIENKIGQLVYIAQDFDSLPTAQSGVTVGGMGVFGTYYSQGGTTSIQADGYRGNALHIKENDNVGFVLKTAINKPSVDFPVYKSFKFKLLNDSGSMNITAGNSTVSSTDSMIIINKDSNGKIYNNSGAQPIVYSLNKWYDVTAKIETSKTTVTVSDGENTCSISRNGAYDHLLITNKYNNAVAAANFEIAIDDVRIIQGDGTQAPVLKSVSHGTAEAAITPNVWSIYPTMDFHFDQPVSGNVSVKDSGDNVVYTTEEITAQDVVTVIPAKLDYEKAYTIDFSNIKSLGGTAANSKLNIYTAPYYTGEMSVGDVTHDTSKRALTVPITFTSSNLKEVDVCVMAVLFGKDSNESSYDSIKWIGREKVFGRAIGDKALVYFDNLPEGFENMTLKIFVIENLDTLRPIFGIK